jgi:hypothetical protein
MAASHSKAAETGNAEDRRSRLKIDMHVGSETEKDRQKDGKVC